ncbi:metallophosphoesterase family protein [Roseimicrobium sp. ORNL1]|uniref:metallophosphoesterase family protein n=1 Tax=Roseimicrobium sp. ORNL1 TaxID=2711231 RepID=UPI0013E1682C|nr:metallophosphoesterase family protein [Roseimicrobium sp. ORNL1]QIF00252.1 metallophosphoesterase [Roseimicrobium sp. ORNL1]
MKRRLFLTQAATGVAALSHAAGQAPATPPPSASAAPASPALATTPPVVMAPRADGAEIVWGVSRHARGWVEVKEGNEVKHFGGNPFGYSTQSTKALRVRLHDLAPGTTYAYRTVTEAMTDPAAREESAWRTLRTLAPTTEETQFLVWNDTHQNNETIARLHAASPDSANFLLWNGDICNDWHKEEQIIPTLLHPAGTDFTAERPLFLVWGNHDLRGQYGYQLADHVAAPEGRSYYAFRSGPVAVVCLNTGEDKDDDHPSFKGRVACEPLRKEQVAWLRSHVLTTPELRDAPYRVVFCHIPLRWLNESEEGRSYDAFSRRSRDLWHDALVEWKAQVVVSGHTHEHAWLPPSPERPYAQLVGGGPKPDAATFMEGHANGTRLQFTMRNLQGEVLQQQEFAPLKTS